MIAESWRARDPSLYGRMDFPGVVMHRLSCWSTTPIRQLHVRVGLFPVVVAGRCPAQRRFPRDADQYNAIQERLISRFSSFTVGNRFIFAAVRTPTKTGYRAVLAGLRRAGRAGVAVYHIEDLGLGVGGVLTDLDDNVSSVHLSCIRWSG